MKLDSLVQTSKAVAEASGRLDKISKLATLLKQLTLGEVVIAIGFFIGWPRQGRLGVGWATVANARGITPAAVPTLELRDVDHAFDALQAANGKGAAGELLRQLRALRAVMLAGDLGAVARAVCSGGEAALNVLASYRLELFRPVQPMLADSASDDAEALGMSGPAMLEWKLDGARIQVHRAGDRVAVYTRNLNDVTSRVPEVVEAVRAFGARELILDGEVIALTSSGRPLCPPHLCPAITSAVPRVGPYPYPR